MTNNTIEQAYQTLEALENELYFQLDALEKAKNELKPMLNKTAKKVASASDVSSMRTYLRNAYEAVGGFVEFSRVEKAADGRVFVTLDRDYNILNKRDYSNRTKGGSAGSKKIATLPKKWNIDEAREVLLDIHNSNKH